MLALSIARSSADFASFVALQVGLWREMVEIGA
jgi:hypothetical protein